MEKSLHEDNIVIISNNKIVAEELKAKIILLRAFDSVIIYDYENAVKSLSKNIPNLIFTYSENNDDTDIIKKIKFNESLKNVPLILVIDNFNQEKMLNAFDDGIDDFIISDINEAQILMRLMWGFQKSQLIKELKTKSEILESIGAIDKDSGFYKSEFTKKIFKSKFEEITTNKDNAVFMSLSADISCKNILPQSFLASIIKKSIRKEDIIGYASDNKFYFILNKTDKNGAIKVYEKIKNSLIDTYSVSAAATRIRNDDFEKVERLINKNLSDALIKGASLIFAEERPSKGFGWLDKQDLKETNFKMFQQMFLKKFAKIVTPVFFQMQTVLQDKLFETKVEQVVNESESIFSLEKLPYKSYITIKYPGYTKINIDIIHISQKDKTTERITFDLNELTQFKLEEILQKLVKKFQENIKQY